MTKTIIAVDVDDVLVEAAAEIIKDYNLKWHTQVTLRDFYATHDTKAWKATDEETVIRRSDQYVQSPAFFALRPTRDATVSLRKLSQNYELHILTGRSDLIAEATREWLEKYFPNIFASVNFSNLYDKEKVRSKGEMCAEMGARVLIDDHIAHTISAASHGLDAVLFGNYPWNQIGQLPKGVTRCKNWAEVLEYFYGRETRS